MEHQELVRGLAGRLIEVSGIRAVVLGGSRARGTHRPDSDVDLGLHYDGTPDLEALTGIVRSLPGNEQVEVAGPGGWGPWVDGGAWLRIDGRPVDWILRDVHRVQEQCARALAGEFSFHAQPGHPRRSSCSPVPARWSTPAIPPTSTGAAAPPRCCAPTGGMPPPVCG